MPHETREQCFAKLKKQHPEKSAAELERIYAQNSNAIRDVEIFATGTHNGDTYTEADLDEMVKANKDLDFRPALKIGHTKDKPGAPAYGWVTNLRRVGSKLLADFSDMHDSVVDALRKRAYDRVSSEIYFNLKRGGKEFKRALKAVALLGVEVPAVAGLVPLHRMEFAAEGEYEKLFEVDAALAVSEKAMFECLSERMSSIIKSFTEEDEAMKPKAQQIKELNEQLAALNEKIVALGALPDKDKGAEIKRLTEQVAAIGTQIKELAAAPAEDAAAKADAEATKAELKKAQEQIGELQADQRRRSVGERVATLKIPAFKPAFEALYAYALAHAAEKVKVYAKDKDGREVSADKSLAEIADGMVEQINSQAAKLFKALASTGAVAREEGSLEADEDPGVEVSRKVTEYQAKNPIVKNYEDAMKAVFTLDPDLARRYRESVGRQH